MLTAFLFLVIGLLAGVIATVAYAVHLDAKLIAKHGKANVEIVNPVSRVILNP